jgi:hypothetical protein
MSNWMCWVVSFLFVANVTLSHAQDNRTGVVSLPRVTYVKIAPNETKEFVLSFENRSTSPSDFISLSATSSVFIFNDRFRFTYLEGPCLRTDNTSVDSCCHLCNPVSE